MSTSQSILADTRDSNAAISNGFRNYCNAQRVDTKTTVLKLFRESYRDYHVTEVEEKNASLFEFAAHDKAQLIFDAEDATFGATRAWRAVGDGIKKKMHPGTLKDEFRFARFQYTWQDKTYIVYYISWQDTFKPVEKLFYILYPCSATNIVDGHCLETDALLLAAGKWTSQLHNEIFVFDNGHWQKSTELYKSVAGANWSDVILDANMKQGLIEDVQGFFDNQAVYEEFSVPWKRGIILHGVPGNGKTVSIKALMSSLYARPDSIPSLYVKSFETNCNTEQFAIRQIFQMARSMAPCLLIFEDLDSLVGDGIRSYFLNEVDGLESNDGILMIGSTNHLDRLDPAISKRPSRFDRKYHFKIPGMEERSMYAEYWRGKLVGKGKVDFPEELVGVVAELTEGFSFAYLKELFVMALLTLVRGGETAEFEMEEVDKEAGADDKVAEKPKVEQQDDICDCAKKCKDCHKPLASSTSVSVKEEKKLDESVKKAKAVMPAIDIPSHLSNSVLLKVIKHQIRILHADMDNTKEEARPSVKINVSGADNDNRAAMARLMRANASRLRG